MIQPNLPIPLAFYYLSHFLTLLFLSSSRVAPWLPSPPLSLLYPSACFAISASLHFALSSPPSLSPSRSPSPSSFHSRSIFPFYFYHPLSIRHRPGEGRGLGDGERRVVMPHIVIAVDTMGENLPRVPLPLTSIIQTCEDSITFCPFQFHSEAYSLSPLAFVMKT